MEKKLNKIWVHQGSTFYNSQFKKFFRDNNIEIYSTYNEEKFIAAEGFIKILKNKIYKHMTAVSKKVFLIL